MNKRANATCCSARYYTYSRRTTERYDGELGGNTKWLELPANGIHRLGLLQAIRGAAGEGADRRVEQSSAEALFAKRTECPQIPGPILKIY